MDFRIDGFEFNNSDVIAGAFTVADLIGHVLRNPEMFKDVSAQKSSVNGVKVNPPFPLGKNRITEPISDKNCYIVQSGNGYYFKDTSMPNNPLLTTDPLRAARLSDSHARRIAKRMNAKIVELKIELFEGLSSSVVSIDGKYYSAMDDNEAIDFIYSNNESRYIIRSGTGYYFKSIPECDTPLLSSDMMRATKLTKSDAISIARRITAVGYDAEIILVSPTSCTHTGGANVDCIL